jgi:hypothetical protein
VNMKPRLTWGNFTMLYQKITHVGCNNSYQMSHKLKIDYKSTTQRVYVKCLLRMLVVWRPCKSKNVLKTQQKSHVWFEVYGQQWGCAEKRNEGISWSQKSRTGVDDINFSWLMILNFRTNLNWPNKFNAIFNSITTFF